MKQAIAGLVVGLGAAALLVGCGAGLNLAERVGIVGADRNCDDAGAGARSDPSSQCFVARRGPDKHE